MAAVRMDLDDGIALITLSNPRKLNAWTQKMRQELAEHFAVAEQLPKDQCAAIVITGDEGNFSAGQDLDEASGWNEDYAETWVRAFRGTYDLARRCSKPVVGAIRGVCAGSAFQFSLCLDYRVSHSTARLGQPEIKSGQASVTGAALLRAAVGSTAMRALVLSAQLVSGDEAHRLGLVDRLVDEDQVLPVALSVAREFGALPAEAYAESKLAICALEDPELDRAFDVAVQAHTAVYASGASHRAIAEFVGRRNHPAPG